MGTPDISSLKATFEAANSYNDWSTAVVVIGLVVEFVALLFFSKDMSKTEKALLVAGSILVAVGVGGEYVFSGRAATAAIALQQASDQTVAGLKAQQESDHKIATQAAAHAAGLGVTLDNLHTFVTDQESRNNAVIGELKRSTAGLNKARDDALAAAEGTKKDLANMTALLNQESVLRQQMIAAMTPRSLSNAQAVAITEQIKPFAKTPFDFSVEQRPEPIGLLGQIGAALKAAGWDWKPWASGGDIVFNFPNTPSVGTTTLSGLVIQIAESDRKTLEQPILALAKALAAANISVTGLQAVPDADATKMGRKPGSIHILIGEKS